MQRFTSIIVTKSTDFKIKGIVNNFTAVEFQLDSSSGALNIKNTLFNGTLTAVGPGGAYIEDFILYTEVSSFDGSSYGYGLVKFQNSSFAMFHIKPDPNSIDTTTLSVFKYTGFR